MLSEFPIDLNKVGKENLDREILRAGLIAELDAISFYEQMAELTQNEDIKKVLLQKKKKNMSENFKPCS